MFILFLTFNAFSKDIDSLTKELKRDLVDTTRVRVLLKISDEYLTADRSKVMSYVNEASKLSNKIDFEYGLIESQNIKGKYYNSTRKLDSAYQVYQNLLELSKKYNSVYAEYNAYIGLGTYHSYKREKEKQLENYYKALEISQNEEFVFGVAGSYKQIASYFTSNQQYDSAFYYLTLSRENYSKIDDQEQLARVLNAFAKNHAFSGDLDSAIYFFERTADVWRQVGDENELADILSNIALVYYYKKDLERFIDNNLKALKIYEKYDNKSGAADKYLDIGVAYYGLKQYAKAIEFYKRAADLYIEMGLEKGLENAYNNIANAYQDIDSTDLALDYYNKAMVYVEKRNNLEQKATIYGNLGLLSKKKKDYSTAEKYYKDAIKINDELNTPGSKKQNALNYLNYADLLKDTGNPQKAVQYLNRSLKISKELGISEILINTYDNLAQVYDSLGVYRNAYQYQKYYTDLKDSLSDAERTEAIAEMNAKFENELLAKDFEIEKEKTKTLELQKENQKVVLYAAVAGIIMFIIMLFVLYMRYRLKKKSNYILERQKQQLFTQKKLVDEKNEEIMASVRYAEKIQRAVIPTIEDLKKYLNDFFIFYIPKDIVSGDFYWFEEKNGNFFIAAVDCTGHGVPGSMLSLIGNMVLNEAVNELNYTSPAQILTHLNQRVQYTLNQREDDSNARDGMDVCLIKIVPDENKIVFSGAKRPLFLINSKNEITSIKGDRSSIGGRHRGKVEFNDKEIDIEKDLSVYLTSDGFVDQIGFNGKKFGTAKLKDFIYRNHHLPMFDQGDQIEREFFHHLGDEEQRDDITIIGIKF